MFVLERRVAALFRAAMRRGLPRRHDQVPILARLSKNGLCMHARTVPFSILYRQTGVTGKGVFAFPASILEQFEGRNNDLVEITLQRPDLAQASWSERGTPRTIEIPLVDPGTVPVPPELPKEYQPVPPSFVTALHEACCTAATEDTKYAVSKVLLSGKNGAIVGTDTRNLLMLGGYSFPFKEDVLIPRIEVFGLEPLHKYEDVGIGTTETHLAVAIGPWTIVLAVDQESRFPDSRSIIPKPGSTQTRLKLHPHDAQRFLDTLTRRIKGPAAREQALTLDLTDAPCLRFEMSEMTMEVPFAESEIVGERVRVCLNLAQFLRALELRFSEFEIRGPDKPIVTRDGERLFMSMPLPAHAALMPRPAAESVPTMSESAHALAPIVPSPVPVFESAPPQFSPIDFLGEADGLKDGLFKVAAHAGRILRFLREVCTQQRVTQIFRSSLSALFDRPATGDKS